MTTPDPDEIGQPPTAAADRGFARLDELTRHLRETAADKAGLIGSLLDPIPLEELAALFRLRRNDYTASLLKCRVRGAAAHLDLLDARVAERATEIGRELDRPDDHEAPMMRRALAAPPDWPDYPVPAGYEVTPGSVSFLRETVDGIRTETVCTEPLYVTGVRVDVGTGREHLALGHRRHGTWRTVILPREVARDARALVASAAQGLPVSSVNARNVVKWVDALESTGGRAGSLPRSECTSRLGWHGDRYIAGPDGALDLDDPHGLRAGWRPAGTWEGWCKALEIIAEEPLAWTLLFVACIPPLQRFLGLGHNPIVDLSGPKGRGKTTLLRLCGSAYGRPDESDGGTIVTWDGTATFLERIAAKSCDVPLLNDETKRVGPRFDMGSTIYALAQGRGKGRGSVDDIRKTATWQTTVISTGEAPVVEFTEAGGARARTLSFLTTPAISCRDVAQALENALAVHHGHLGRRIAASALAQEGSTPGGLRARHRLWLERWGEENRTADTRLLSIVAAVEVAAEACRSVGVPAPPETWRDELAHALTASVAMADQPTNALDILRAELSMHPSAYLRRDPPRDADGNPRAQLEPHGGWRGVIGRKEDEWAGFYPPVLRRLLGDAGHDLTPLVVQWAEDDTLVPGTHGRQLEVTIDHRKHRMYCFRTGKVM